MVADAIVLTALHYIDRGMKADQKLQEMQAAKQVKQKHEMDKAASRAQNGATRHNQKSNKKTQANNGSGKKHHNIQQPKRD